MPRIQIEAYLQGRMQYLSLKKNIGLNTFLIHIKFGPFKFSPYLILIVLLVLQKKIALGISPSLIQICLIYV